MGIKFGCHGSTWELDYDKECDYLDHIMDTVKEAGFKGIDVQVALLGRYKNTPEKLHEALEIRGLQLAALTIPFSWLGDVESEEEKQLADYYIYFLQHFEGAIMNLPVRNGPNRDNLLTRQRQIINCANIVAKRAFNKGVLASFHPASPLTSYFRTIEDYNTMFELIDREYLSYTPDAGHIQAGGMNPEEIVRSNIEIIKHVHFKDCSYTFEWRKMGDGDIDFPAIVQILNESSYQGWIMIEEETEEAATNPRDVILNAGNYVTNNLLKIR